MAGTTSLELEIINLYREGHGHDFVCEELYAKLDRSDAISPSEINNACHFLKLCGRFDLIKKLFVKSLKRAKFGLVPIGLIIDTAYEFNQDLKDSDLNLMESIVAKNLDEPSAMKSTALNFYSMRVIANFNRYHSRFKENRKKQKNLLIEQLNKHRIYNLAEQEEQSLDQLIRLFPEDIDIKFLQQAHLEKKAENILNRIHARGTNHLMRPIASQSNDEKELILSFTKSLKDIGEAIKTKSPEQLYNLAVLAFQIELYEPALEFINLTPDIPARDWLKAEILLESKRFLDLLKHIEGIEKNRLVDSDAIYGASYLKALAYNGLGQRALGLQLLEQISSAHPNFRSTEALIVEWKSSSQ